MIQAIIFTAILGAFFNRIRGGLHGPVKKKILVFIAARFGLHGKLWKIVNRLLDGKIINALAFGLFCAVVYYSAYQGIIEGLPVYVFVDGALALFAFQFVMMLRGSAPGWGDYIGAAGGWRSDNLGEVEYIDRWIEPLKDRPVLWGMAGLSIRCAEWGLYIGAPLLSFWPVLAGLLAGPLCWLAARINKKRAWELFEALLGAALWVSILV